MTVTRKDFNIDGLHGIIYDFTELGDGIPPHSHGRRDSHLSIVTNGRFRMFTEGEDPVDMGPGRVVNYPAGVEHSSECIEVPGRLVFVFRFHLPVT